jgi:hypothetical protein
VASGCGIPDVSFLDPDGGAAHDASNLDEVVEPADDGATFDGATIDGPSVDAAVGDGDDGSPGDPDAMADAGDIPSSGDGACVDSDATMCCGSVPCTGSDCATSCAQCEMCGANDRCCAHKKKVACVALDASCI